MTSQQLLKATSRAFYLSLRILPQGARQTMSLAYLLARCADSVSDGNWLAADQRQPALHDFLLALLEGQSGPWKDRVSTVNPEGGSEARLLHHLPQALEELEQLAGPDQRLVRDIVETLTRGMAIDLDRFPGCVEDSQELRRHLWAAAGCVGSFWTAVLRLHDPRVAALTADLENLGTDLGNALQLTNVLRDIAGDLRDGRCYLPREQLTALQLRPEDLQQPQHEAALAPLIYHWLNVNLDLYQNSLPYVLCLPARCWRLRLAALWPWLLGVATCRRLIEGGWLQGPKIKVPRRQVYTMIGGTLGLVFFTPWLKRHMEGRLEQARRALRAKQGA